MLNTASSFKRLIQNNNMEFKALGSNTHKWSAGGTRGMKLEKEKNK